LEEILNEIVEKLGDQNVSILRAVILDCDDVIIFHQRILLQNLMCDIDRSVVVDISKNLAEPRHLNQQQVLAEIIEMRKEVAKQISENEDTKCFSLKRVSTWNVSTLFGFLLDYPVSIL
jgi:hypothetical protein